MCGGGSLIKAVHHRPSHSSGQTLIKACDASIARAPGRARLHEGYIIHSSTIYLYTWSNGCEGVSSSPVRRPLVVSALAQVGEDDGHRAHDEVYRSC